VLPVLYYQRKPFLVNETKEETLYAPTAPEIAITLGVYGVGLLVLTFLYKVAVAVKEETA
jgi:molybdopterin-containing oxidoreductase family membrane subunit